MKIARIVARMDGDLRRAYRINRKKDGSIVVEPESKSALQRVDPRVTAHQSGDFHVKYGTPKGRHRSRVKSSLPDGQAFSKFKGCVAVCANVISKSNFNKLKRFESKVPAEFVVDLNQFSQNLITITVFLFDPSSLTLFQAEASKFLNPVIKTIASSSPNIGLVAHE